MIMEKRVQLIKQKAGVGLSLFLVLTNQMAAQAGTCSDKTKWLTNNLEKPLKGTSDQSLTTLKALSAQPENSKQTNSIIVSCSDDPTHTIKLRPFMANRKLPSRHELELALIEQKAKLAQENDARLSGQVSTFVVGEDNQASPSIQPYPSNSYRQRAAEPKHDNLTRLKNVSRNYFLQSPTKSAQNSFSLMKQAEQHLLSTGKQQMTQSNSFATNSATGEQTISSVNGSSINIEALNSMPINATNSQAMPVVPMNWTSEECGPSAFSLSTNALRKQIQVSSSDFGAAGPPPFPLNLLPEASLKQLIKSLAGSRSSSSSTNGSNVAFGSWHSPYPLNSVSGNRSSNLPYAGFQSHLTKPYASSDKKANFHYVSALPAVTGAHRKSSARKQKTRDAANQRDAAIRVRMLLDSQVRVATYPAYTTQSLKPWNFAQ